MSLFVYDRENRKYFKKDEDLIDVTNAMHFCLSKKYEFNKNFSFDRYYEVYAAVPDMNVPVCDLIFKMKLLASFEDKQEAIDLLGRLVGDD